MLHVFERLNCIAERLHEGKEENTMIKVKDRDYNRFS